MRKIRYVFYLVLFVFMTNCKIETKKIKIYYINNTSEVISVKIKGYNSPIFRDGCLYNTNKTICYRCGVVKFEYYK